MPFTYTYQDEQRVLDAVQDPVKRRLVELIFVYAHECGGLYERDFIEIQEITK